MKEPVMVPTLLDSGLFRAALDEDGGLFCNKDTGGQGGIKCQSVNAVILLSTECGFHCGRSM